MKRTEWGKYRLDELFEITGTKSLDSNAIDFTEQGINFVGRTSENNGIQGKIQERDFSPNEAFTITATVIGNYKYVKYQKEPYYCSQNINKLKPKKIIVRWTEETAYFFIANVQKFVSMYDNQQGGYKLEDIKNHYIYLPQKNGTIDFDFIESFIVELEAEHLVSLSECLTVSGLDDYELIANDKAFVGNDGENFCEIKDLLDERLKNIEWKEYKLGDLFTRIQTKKLPYKAKELPNKATGNHVLPCLTSSFRNQGLNYYVPKEGATVLKNVISIPSNSDVYRAYFQPMEFTVLSDSYAICWKSNDIIVSPNQYLFMVLCINKVTDLPIYSYKNKLGGWNVVKNKKILLPQTNEKIDFVFMETFVKIMKKLLIKDVVLYAQKKSNKTK